MSSPEPKSDDIRNLYHATTKDSAEIIKGGDDLFGYTIKDSLWVSGTLTDDELAARRWLVEKLEHPGGEVVTPIVLVFAIPADETYQISSFHGIGVFGLEAQIYATTYQVSLNDLPIEYLQILIQTYNYSIDLLRNMEENGEIAFHRVPHEYLVKE